MLNNQDELNYRLIWNTRKELVLAALSLAFAFIIFAMVFLRQIAPIKDAFAELATTNKELAKFQTKVDELENIAFDSEYDKMTEVDDVLPSYKPLLELLNNLNGVAVESETLIKNFSISPGEIATDSTLVTKSRRHNAYDELVLEFSVSGTLGNVQNFMTLIEQVTPISTITNISLSQQINDDSSIETTANLKLKTFFFTQSIAVTLTEPLPAIENEHLIILEEIKKLIPSNLPTQEEVIKHDRGNLFGIQGMSVEEIEAQLRASQVEAEEIEWQTVDETGQIIEENINEGEILNTSDENPANQENTYEQAVPAQ